MLSQKSTALFYTASYLILMTSQPVLAVSVTKGSSNPYFVNTGNYITKQSFSDYHYKDPDTNTNLIVSGYTELQSTLSGNIFTQLSPQSITQPLSFLNGKSAFDTLTTPLGSAAAFGSSVRTTNGSLYDAGWDFKVAQSLQGKFNLLNYYPCVPFSSPQSSDTLCGEGIIDQPALANRIQGTPLSNSVGAGLLLTYEPGPNDPKINQANLHWMQFVFTDTPDKAEYTNGKNFFIDNNGSSTVPYYGGLSSLSGVLVNSTNPPAFYFADVPSRDRILYDRDWTALLYLVEVVQTGSPTTNIAGAAMTNYQVKIYDGISWGWKTVITDIIADASDEPPPPSSSGNPLGPPPPSTPRAFCPPDMPPISCEAFGYYDSQDALVAVSTPSFDDPTLQIATLADVLSPSDNTAAVLELNNASESLDESSFQTAPLVNTTSSSSSSNAAGVPEPSDALGVIVAVGMWGGISWRRRKAKPLDSKPETSRNP